MDEARLRALIHIVATSISDELTVEMDEARLRALIHVALGVDVEME